MVTLIDYQVQLVKFPPGKINEAVTKNEDGSYTIFIERNLTHEIQKQKLLHALSHILKDDFSKEDVQKLEYIAHQSIL